MGAIGGPDVTTEKGVLRSALRVLGTDSSNEHRVTQDKTLVTSRSARKRCHRGGGAAWLGKGDIGRFAKIDYRDDSLIVRHSNRGPRRGIRHDGSGLDRRAKSRF